MDFCRQSKVLLEYFQALKTQVFSLLLWYVVYLLVRFSGLWKIIGPQRFSDHSYFRKRINGKCKCKLVSLSRISLILLEVSALLKRYQLVQD